MYKVLYYATIAIHYYIVLCFVLCAIISWNSLPFYVYFTLLSTIIRIIFSRDMCPLTMLENYFGKKLGYKESKGFLKDWILNPLNKIKKRIKNV